MGLNKIFPERDRLRQNAERLRRELGWPVRFTLACQNLWLASGSLVDSLAAGIMDKSHARSCLRPSCALPGLNIDCLTQDNHRAR